VRMLLVEWLALQSRRTQYASDNTVLAEVVTALHEGEARFRAAGDKKIDWYQFPNAIYTPTVGFSRDEIACLQRHFMAAWERGGSGAPWHRFAALGQIALDASPENLPFLLQTLALTKPKEFRPQDRFAMVLVALTVMAEVHPESEAESRLLESLNLADTAARSAAAQCLHTLYERREIEVPPEVAEAIRKSMGISARLPTRLNEARERMAAGRTPVTDNPKGIYVLDVYHREFPRVTRTIAIRSKQTFEQLHRAIQSAFEWNNDHLFAFFLNGRAYDRTSAIVIPEDAYEVFPVASTPPKPELEIESPNVFNMAIGMIGLEPGDTFLYLFDFGDDHHFNVVCKDVLNKAEPGRYPRVIARKGRSPEQYPSYGIY
ncbi:MAG: IS1096 element passenger TnpR family protein, partial [Caldilineaceae bacterium]